jgi:transcriptional regulator with XRE-family HTH domain
MTDLAVRRRAGLMGLLTAASLLFAVAYGWVYAQSGDGRALAVAVLLGCVALLQLWAWRRARQPMLVADVQGIRIRLGSRWAGLMWADIERVEVSERGLIRDGRIAVVARSLGSALAHAGLRARAAAWLNTRMYGQPLVVPYGLTTTVSAVDPAGAVERLSGGSAAVMRVGDLDARPAEPAVIVTPHAEHEAEADVEPSIGDDSAAAGPAVAAAASARGPMSVTTVRAPEGTGARDAVRAAERPAARREEVSVGGRVPFGIVGDLALARQPETAGLPEMEQLRRRPDPVRTPRGADNVSLIIDATTDLSARAMRKVRRAQARSASADSDAPAPAPETPWTTVIGDRLRGARLRAGLDIDELAERTRIRPYVIESIEADDFGPCGGDFYARGHLRTLARYLNADAEALVADYDANFATSPVSPREVFEVELATGGSRLVRGGERSANWAAIVAAVLVLALIWGLAKFFTDGSAQPGELSPPTQTASGLGSPGPGNPPVTGPVMARVKVKVADTETRVVVRDRFKRILFDGVLKPGASRKFHGEAPLRVMAADGGAVRLKVKGKSLGVMGDPGVRARERIGANPVAEVSHKDPTSSTP